MLGGDGKQKFSKRHPKLTIFLRNPIVIILDVIGISCIIIHIWKQYKKSKIFELVNKYFQKTEQIYKKGEYTKEDIHLIRNYGMVILSLNEDGYKKEQLETIKEIKDKVKKIMKIVE